MYEIIASMTNGMQAIVEVLDERVQLLQNDLVEPLDMYINHHNETFHLQFDQAKQLFHDLYEKETKHNECKRQYMNLCQESEQVEIDIEKALLS